MDWPSEHSMQCIYKEVVLQGEAQPCKKEEQEAGRNTKKRQNRKRAEPIPNHKSYKPPPSSLRLKISLQGGCLSEFK